MSHRLPFAISGGGSGAATPAPASPAAGRPMKMKAGLRMLKEELSSIPHEEKAALVHAQRVAPELVDDDHMMGFLRSEQFDAGLAARRLVRYWEHRHRVFGDSFALPMTLDGAMKDGLDALRMGPLVLLPELDDRGRAIVHYDHSALVGYDREAEERMINKTIQVWFYLLHVAMEEERVLRKGFVLLGDVKQTTHQRAQNFDAKWKLTVAVCTSDRYMPIRWRAAHFYNDNCPSLFSLFSGAFRAILSAAQREAFVLHDGPETEILGTLTAYGLSRRCVPKSAGGDIDLSAAREAFLQQRRSIEGSSGPGDTSDKKTPPEMNLKSGDVPDNLPTNSAFPGEKSPALLQLSDDSGSLASSVSDPPAAKTKSKGNTSQRKRKGGPSKAKDHPGARGDDRMNRALQAILSDPEMPFLAALQAGGFDFPGIEDKGVKVAEVEDLDGISFGQRRNQLMRRIRWQKKKAEKVAAR